MCVCVSVSVCVCVCVCVKPDFLPVLGEIPDSIDTPAVSGVRPVHLLSPLSLIKSKRLNTHTHTHTHTHTREYVCVCLCIYPVLYILG